MKRIADLVLESATDYAIITTDLAGRITYWSPGAAAILGWSADEITGQPVDVIFSPEDRANNVAAVELGNALARGRSIDERWHVKKDGSTFWASGEMLPLVDGGAPEGFLKILRDRTAHKRAEELQNILTQELGHRIKNMIAVTQSIVNQSFQGAPDLPSAKQIISQRLAILSGAQDILLAGNTSGASIADLVDKALGVVAREEGGRIWASGPDVHLGRGAAMSLALIIHELLTNAFKYGSLSQDEGRVDIAWQLSTMDGVPALAFAWTESGGPAVVPPSGKGFGSRLLRGGITGAKSAVELNFDPRGLQCRITADLAGVQRD